MDVSCALTEKKDMARQSFLQGFLSLLARSGSKNREARKRRSVFGRKSELTNAFEELEDATSYIRDWAAKERKKNPQFAEFERRMRDQMK